MREPLYASARFLLEYPVRRKGIWLQPKHLMRWHTSNKLHAHTADACVQAFFAALSSWRQRRKDDPDAKPPHKRKWSFRIEYKRSAMKLVQGTLRFFRTRWSSAGRERSTRRLLPTRRKPSPVPKESGLQALILAKCIWRRLTMAPTRIFSMGGSCAPKSSTATSCKPPSIPASTEQGHRAHVAIARAEREAVGL